MSIGVDILKISRLEKLASKTEIFKISTPIDRTYASVP